MIISVGPYLVLVDTTGVPHAKASTILPGDHSVKDILNTTVARDNSL